MNPQIINWVERARKQAPLLLTMVAFLIIGATFIYFSAFSEMKNLESEKEQQKKQNREKLK